MKIGIDARMYSAAFTGIGRYTFELIRHLAKLDTKNEYVCFLRPEQFKTFQTPASNFRAVAVAAPHYSLAEQTQFLQALNKADLDLMHFTNFNTPLLYREPTVVTIHDLTLSFFPGQKMVAPWHRLAYNLVLKRSVSHANQLIAVSQHTKADLLDLLHTSPNKVTVIYNGVGSEFRPAADPAAVRADLAKHYRLKDDYLLYTGVWRDHKNILGLLEAFAELRKRTDFAGQLVLTGRPDPVYAPAVHAVIGKHELHGAVVLTGLVPEADLLKLMQGARVFVLPSFYEGFGLPPLEAMACGIPVAVSNASAIPEICGHENALFFDPENQTEMVAQISKAWTDEKTRQTLREHGLKRAKEFSWEKMAQETVRVYGTAMGR